MYKGINEKCRCKSNCQYQQAPHNIVFIYFFQDLNLLNIAFFLFIVSNFNTVYFFDASHTYYLTFVLIVRWI